MLGKLMTYEIKATARVFLPLYGALLAVSGVNRLLTAMGNDGASAGIGKSVAVILIIAIFVITLVLTLQRFRRNLLDSEGYLMFTLPVSVDQLIWSKLLISAMWCVAGGLIVLLSIAIMTLQNVDLTAFFGDLGRLFQMIRVEDVHVGLYMLEFVVGCVLSLFASILMLYSCQALSLLAQRHRGLWSFTAFVGFCIIGQVLFALLTKLVADMDLTGWINGFPSVAQTHIMLLMMVVAGAVVSGVFYAITRYMLKNRLNLE